VAGDCVGDEVAHGCAGVGGDVCGVRWWCVEGAMVLPPALPWGWLVVHSQLQRSGWEVCVWC
jgi:hypothetical protein